MIPLEGKGKTTRVSEGLEIAKRRVEGLTLVACSEQDRCATSVNMKVD